jgi:hypothetical protein
MSASLRYDLTIGTACDGVPVPDTLELKPFPNAGPVLFIKRLSKMRSLSWTQSSRCLRPAPGSM